MAALPSGHGGTAAHRVGNTLQALCERVALAYGWELQFCWAVFGEALDPGVRDRLAASATAVMARVQAMICAVAALAWTALMPGWWPKVVWIALCLAVTAAAHQSLRINLDRYANQVWETVTAHRVRLYRVTGMPLPTDTRQERQAGERLSAFLRRDLTSPAPLDWPL